MRPITDPIREQMESFRVMEGPLGSNMAFGNNGAFIIRTPARAMLQIIIADGDGWEHVSVSVAPDKPSERRRLPTWEEMNFVKELFWSDDETVVQFHPRKTSYVNLNPWVLHLWRKIGLEYMLPPSYMITAGSLGMNRG